MITITNIHQTKSNTFDKIWAIVQALENKSSYLELERWSRV